MADAGAPGEFTKGKLKALGFTQDFKGGLDDRAAQIAMVVGTQVAFGFWPWIKITFLAIRLSRKVADVNITHSRHPSFADRSMLTATTFLGLEVVNVNM